jgi:hypothetical protein
MVTTLEDLREQLSKNNISLKNTIVKRALKPGRKLTRVDAIALVKLVSSTSFKSLNSEITELIRKKYGAKILLERYVTDAGKKKSHNLLELQHIVSVNHPMSNMTVDPYSWPGTFTVMELEPDFYTLSVVNNRGLESRSVPLPYTYLLMYHNITSQYGTGNWITNLLRHEHGSQSNNSGIQFNAKLLGVYFSKEKIKNPKEQMVYRPFLPNFYMGGSEEHITKSHPVMCAHPEYFQIGTYPQKGKKIGDKDLYSFTDSELNYCVGAYDLAVQSFFSQGFNGDNFKHNVPIKLFNSMQKKVLLRGEYEKPYTYENYFDIWSQLTLKQFDSIPIDDWPKSIPATQVFGPRKTTKDKKHYELARIVD